MKTAIITLSQKGLVIAEKLSRALDAPDIFIHSDVDSQIPAKKFAKVLALTDEIFDRYQGLIYIMPTGVVLRAIAPKIQNKLTDPAVVAIDVAARFVVSLLSGHEGRANELTIETANILDADPVISTTTEAEKLYIVGIGCRKDANRDDIIDAVKHAAAQAAVDLNEVRLLASADIKKHETGLLQASEKLNIPIRFISSEKIKNTRRDFKCSQLVQEKVNLPAVAEPTALLAGTRTTIVLPRTICNHVTVAIAKESSLWSE